MRVVRNSNQNVFFCGGKPSSPAPPPPPIPVSRPPVIGGDADDAKGKRKKRIGRRDLRIDVPSVLGGGSAEGATGLGVPKV
jgi:hypothetical protein